MGGILGFTAILFFMTVFATETAKAEEDCPIYKQGPTGYYISGHEQCTNQCCGTEPDTYCCARTVYIAVGTTGGFGGLASLVCIWYFCCKH